MAGLDPAIHAVATAQALTKESEVPAGWVYIMTNRPNGIPYIGFTSNLAKRIWEHREGTIDGFNKRYGLKRLVYAEPHEDIRIAIQREKALKHWPRAWKVRLILESNPGWADLFDLVPPARA